MKAKEKLRYTVNDKNSVVMITGQLVSMLPGRKSPDSRITVTNRGDADQALIAMENALTCPKGIEIIAEDEERFALALSAIKELLDYGKRNRGKCPVHCMVYINLDAFPAGLSAEHSALFDEIAFSPKHGVGVVFSFRPDFPTHHGETYYFTPLANNIGADDI